MPEGTLESWAKLVTGFPAGLPTMRPLLSVEDPGWMVGGNQGTTATLPWSATGLH